ncbi:MAG: outer membrane beta-barrel protein [Janthinobacterium lividum]
MREVVSKRLAVGPGPGPAALGAGAGPAGGCYIRPAPAYFPGSSSRTMSNWIALALLAGGPAALRAQAPGGPAEAPPKLSWGMRAALNYANTNFNAGEPPPPAPVATTWRPGYEAGLWVSVALPHRWLVRQEYAFAQLGGEVTGGPRYTLRYLSLPLLLGYQVLPRVQLLLGPRFDLLIQAQQVAGGQPTDITHDTEERSVGATAGVAVALGRHLGLGARYFQGFNHIGIGQRSAVQEFKFAAVQLAADYRF